ncbi:TPA: GntR family transcriptional regulator [Stenotrophomonas maltophilia]|jgi:GntR family transcriptional regulator|uniref:GntR family transcriptional regulator n=2 Tax=Stenotrophomonas maltophilia TaxID=40324 RepID=A0AAI9CK28_STEMA|nr:GntR family transcriptional regulator [Stenotrophomonas maltophilia]EKU9962461.1 GntR family transcriptional regulator [Stenotrophomonas maltophilia]EKZ1926550.1 GntR family transcriptional regulator [Stenotrophomonas maltophilia]ELE7121241.1 GntR family transcriptional regulator [Stenotrophomonas maltophilia]EMB2746797.1 GntR family transcriptional regulator [Stenotrophomonas maltophilia]MBH1377191.1 GntR family transcriptional regulator [Stenotrophomonas maltophilia]
MTIGLRLNSESHTPITVQITDRIATLIRTGKLRPGQLLPSVRQGAEDWSVNFSTVSRAYKDLQAEGLIELNKSRRMQVAKVAPMTPDDRAVLLRPAILGLKARARELGLTDAQFQAEVIATLGLKVAGS